MTRVVVLAIDGLGSKYLGPYGNTWIETLAFNELAADSLLVHGMYAPFAEADKTVEALWNGGLSIAGSASPSPSESMLDVAHSRGCHTSLLTDDADLLDTKLAAAFAEQLEVDASAGIKLANEWDETHTAQFFAQAIDSISRLDDNALLWIHSRGLSNSWDAPYEFRAQFAEEDDPEPSGSAQVPSLTLDASYDPDTLHEIQCAFAGQIALLDRCLGVLVSVLQSEAQDVLFVLTSPRGFPLGEHFQVGWSKPTLHQELLSIPLLVRFPQRKFALRRQTGLYEVNDLVRFLSRSLGETPSDGDWLNSLSASANDRLYSVSRGVHDWLLRTPVWQLRIANLGQSTETAELYLKPDDQNEVNDVADRCVGVVEAGRAFLNKLIEGKTLPDDEEIPEILLEAME